MNLQPIQLEFDDHGAPLNLPPGSFRPLLLYGYETRAGATGALVEPHPMGPVIAAWDRRFSCWLKASGSQLDWIPTHYLPVGEHPGVPGEDQRARFEAVERARSLREHEKTGVPEQPQAA